MDPRLSFVTLAVPDLDAVRRFYVDGLGWPVELEADGEVIMIRVADKVVAQLGRAIGISSGKGGARIVGDGAGGIGLNGLGGGHPCPFKRLASDSAPLAKVKAAARCSRIAPFPRRAMRY